MKRNLFLLFFCTLLSFNAIAGYLIRGVYTSDVPNLKNYTLTIDASGVPISAASMNSLGTGTVKNSIVIVRSDISGAYVFPIALPSDPYPLDVEVRDFHYDSENDKYVLCGSRETHSNTTFAFVAVINSNFTAMQFMLHSEANLFYSIVANFPTLSIPQSFDYYVCGKKGDYGVVASIDRNSLNFTNYYKTDIPWEYNKIIVKSTTPNSLLLVVSGRTPTYSRVGITTFDPSFMNRNSYMWYQTTEPNSLCVVADYHIHNDVVILAASYQNYLYLHPIYFSLLPATSVSRFSLGTQYDRFYIQDIGMFVVQDNTIPPRISVAGFTTGFTPQIKAWYGYVNVLTWGVLTNKIFFNSSFGNRFEHHKIRYDQYANEYTGGYSQSVTEMCVLFASPRNQTICDDEYPGNPTSTPVVGASFALSQSGWAEKDFSTFNSYPYDLALPNNCDILKGGSAPEYSMRPPENESEIVTYYDRVTVKDTPEGVIYQIYTVTGQLIQTGTSNPDISTAQLSKGMYILRLENGKAFKFFK